MSGPRGPGRLTAFLTALVFLLHPAQTAAVAWVSAQSNLLYTFFYLAAFILFLRKAEKPSRALYAASLACFVLSLLSKEMGVTLPLVLALYVYFRRNQTDSQDKPSFRSLWPYFAIAALYVVARSYVLGQTAQTGFWAGGFVPQVLTMLKGFAHYVRIMVFPHPLSLEYLFPVKHVPDAEVLGCALLADSSGR